MKKEERKKQFRNGCLKRLASFLKHGTYTVDKQISQKIYRLIRRDFARDVMLYIPLKTEVNIDGLIIRLRRERRKVYVPFMEGKSFRLVEYRLPLREKKFGIKEPNDSKKYRKKGIDFAIVPIVGVDYTQRRVGFGKGMYDRFFEKNSIYIKKTVFVTRKLCYTKELVTDNHDVRADMILSRQRDQRIGNVGDSRRSRRRYFRRSNKLCMVKKYL